MRFTTSLSAACAALALASSASAQVYQLTREESVRFDNPRLQPRLEWMVDEPAPIDKQSFRVLQSDDYEPHLVYVRFRPGTSPLERDAAHASAGARAVVWQSQLVPDLYLVSVDSPDAAVPVNAYLDRPSTLYAEPSYRGRVETDPNDPYYTGGDLWGMGTGNGGSANGWGTYAQWAWDEWQGDQSFVVAIIDSGIQTTHPDLAVNLWANPGEIAGNGVDDDGNGYVDDVVGWDFTSAGACVGPSIVGVTPCGNPGDNNPNPDLTCADHGTHVAGTVGARGNNGIGVVGVNWRCSLMALKCQTAGSCTSLTNTTLALDYAAANGARVSNNSYGSSSFSQTTYDEILASQTVGHLFVAAAGNDGDNTDVTPHYPSSYSLSNIISVAGVEPDGDLAYQDTIFEDSFDSNYGPTTVDLAAPGVKTWSTVTSSGYGKKNGTSMATPHVTGVIALVWSKYPELTWIQVRDRILTGTNPNGTLAGKVATGGTVNAHRALGIWVSPTGAGGQFGTKFQPFSHAFLWGALIMLPKSGTLDFQGGTLTKSQWDSAKSTWSAVTGKTLGSEPMILRSNGGTVRIGVL